METFNPYQATHPSMKRSIDYTTPYRRAQYEWAKSINPSHFVTFNFYDDYSVDRTKKILDQWYCFIHQKIFGKPARLVEADRRIVLIAFPEHTDAGHIHFHAATRIHPGAVAKFEKFAGKVFKNRVPTGNVHIREIGETDADLHDAMWYLTKDRFSAEFVIPGEVTATDMSPVKIRRPSYH